MDGFLKNDDGTVTLTFSASNACRRAMSYVAFSLPEGMQAISPADGSVYQAGASYEVTNPTENPFYGIKFTPRSEGLKRGATDVFAFTLPASALAAIDEIQTAMKVGPSICTSSLAVVIPGSLGGRVWNDANENGIADPEEAGMEGISVVLWSCGGGASTGIISHAVTEADGFYVFEDLTPAAYAVQVFAPVGFFFGPKDAPDVDEILDSDVEQATGFADCLVILNAEDNLTVNGGLVQALFPDVKANDSDEPIVLSPSAPLTVTVSLFAHALAAAYEGEFWIVAESPVGFYSYNPITQVWTPGFQSAGHYPLVNYAPILILDLEQAGAALPEGVTTFYLGIDLIVNGQLDDYIADFVGVTIQPN